MANVGATTTSAADIFNSIAGAKAKSDTTSVAGDLENRFLTLLMAQIKNQDPLNPLDNAQVTSQLAQLNTVNGIEKLNATMSQLLTGYADAQAMQAAGMIGKNVMVAGNNLPLAGGQAVGGIVLDGNADSVQVAIKDASGKLVQTEELGAHAAGSFYFVWDGKDANEMPVAEGVYTFEVKASTGGEAVKATSAQIGTVSAVVREKNGFLLDLGSLGSVAFKDVQQIL